MDGYLNPAAELERRVAPLLPLVAELEQALLAEAQALRQRDAGALLAAVEAKRRCSRTLDDRLAAAELPTKLFVSTLPADMPVWQEFLERLGRCRKMNQAAGSAIAALQRHTDASLRLLGLSPEPAAYGANGRAERSAPARKIVVC